MLRRKGETTCPNCGHSFIDEARLKAAGDVEEFKKQFWG
jgi:uncharacterized Zn finger protein (UPF0148 family)